MRSKKLLALMLAGALVVPTALALPAGANKAKPKVVGTDKEGDWGSTVDPMLGPAGGPLSQDLLEAAIADAGDEIHFVITVAGLPPNGGVPEFTRYTWDLFVDGEFVALDGKWTNYSRGACDPTAGTCPPPRDPGQQPFSVRGNCTQDQVIVCEEMGFVQAVFDTENGTITIPVPKDLIGAKPGSKIAPALMPGAGYTGSVVAMPSAYYSIANLPHDDMVVDKVFKVPGKKKAKKKNKK